MRDINIQVYDNHKVNTENDYAGLNLENLQGNITFNFDNFVSGQARVEVVINNQDGYILLDQVGETYTLPIKSSLLTGDSILMQLVIDEVDKTTYHLTIDTDINHNKTYYIKVGNSFEVVEHPQKADLGTYYEAEIPVWKSEVFYLAVGNSINATTTIPEEYPSWVEVINGLINEVDNSLQEVETALTEMNNLNIDVSNKVGGKVTITFTDKEGIEKQVTIDDGIGIVSITKSSTSGNVDTYTITYTDGHTTTFQVTNGIDGTDGVGITSIYLTGTSGLTDTYTILYTNGETTTFQVKNGKGITKIEKISTTGLIDTYKITYNDGTTQNYEVGNGRGIVSIVKTSTSGYVDTYTITYNDNTTSTFEVTNGEVTQAQLDEVIAENDYLNSIIDQIVPKTTGTGTSITLDDTLEAKMNMSLNPSELEQETTTGKNLANINNIDDRIGLANIKMVITNDTIVISDNTSTNGYAETKKTLSQICPNLQVGDDVYLRYNNTSSTSAKNKIYLTSPAGLSWDKDTSKVITQNMLDGQVVFYGGNNGETAVISEFMITTSSDTTYEPYTGGIASPNPQYPQEVHTISGSNTIKVVGTQLFDGIMELGIINGNTGANASNSSYIRCKNYIEVEEQSNYKITSPDITGSMLVYEYKADYSYNLTTNKLIGQNEVLTTNVGTKYIRFRPNKETTDITTRFMVNKGDTALPYTPYQEQTAQVNLGDLEYCKIGNYEDEFMKPSGNNLFDVATWVTKGNNSNYYSYSNGKLSINATDSRTITDFVDGDKIILPNGNYYLSNIGNATIRIYNQNNNSPVTTNQFEVTLGYIYLKLVSSSVMTCEPMINKGTTALPYEPYNNGKWYLKKNIGKVVFDGSENWETSTTGIFRIADVYPIDVALRTEPPFAYSNYYKYAYYSANITSSIQNGEFSWNDSKYPVFRNDSCADATAFKTWLSTHNTIVYYAMTTSTYTLLNDTLQTQLDTIESMLLSYKGQTNISQINNDLPFIMTSTALKEL